MVDGSSTTTLVPPIVSATYLALSRGAVHSTEAASAPVLRLRARGDATCRVAYVLLRPVALRSLTDVGLTMTRRPPYEDGTAMQLVATATNNAGLATTVMSKKVVVDASAPLAPNRLVPRCQLLDAGTGTR